MLGSKALFGMTVFFVVLWSSAGHAAGRKLDRDPDPFSFVDLTDVAVNSAIMSKPIVVRGVNTAVRIKVSGGLYSKNGRGFTARAGKVSRGDRIRVRQTSASLPGTATHTVVNIGSGSDTFTVTTLAAPTAVQTFLSEPLSAGNPSFVSSLFSGSGNCKLCHNSISDSSGQDLSIETDWSSTLMANATRDPFWRAKLRSELNRNPGVASVINDKCTHCHAPMANTEAERDGYLIEALDGGFLNAANPYHDQAMEGVSCSLCHQIKDSEKLGSLAGISGEFEIADEKKLFGPYSDPLTNPMTGKVGYTPTHSPHIQQSKLCATCHDLKTPYVDSEGKVLSTTPESEFPEQMPFAEWEHSLYSTTEPKSCQDCHMKRSAEAAISTRPKWLPKRSNVAAHELVGGNVLMLDILDQNRTQLGVLSNNFAETIAKTETMLQGAASIAMADAHLLNGILDFRLKLTSNTGHKLPTAYPSRRMILHVTVRDASNRVVFESGKINPDGSVAGADSDTQPSGYEPHYDLISAENQVQIYEAIMRDDQGQVTHTLLRGMAYLKDNRLLPLGFDKLTASADIGVVGNAATDENFTGGSDEVEFQVAGMTDPSYHIDVELIYQPISVATARDMFVDNSPEVADFKIMFDKSRRKSSVMVAVGFDIAH